MGPGAAVLSAIAAHQESIEGGRACLVWRRPSTLHEGRSGILEDITRAYAYAEGYLGSIEEVVAIATWCVADLSLLKQMGVSGEATSGLSV